MTQQILVTGGLGYIGSHTVVELISAGYTPVIADNLVNTNRDVLTNLEHICGKKIDFQDLISYPQRLGNRITLFKNIKKSHSWLQLSR